jgi:hypothetical protein
MSSLNSLPENDTSFDFIYNVEFTQGNGKYMTFTAKLENVDADSFWFRREGAIMKVSQDRVEWMMPMENLREQARKEEIEKGI